jgi:hypothetical protein
VAAVYKLVVGVVLVAATTGCEVLSVLTSADPAPSFSNVEGQWTGTFTTIHCTVSNATLQSYCDLVVSAEPTPFVLTLAQFEGELVGSFQLKDILVPVSGGIDASGLMQLSGSATATISGSGTVTIMILDWSTTVNNGTLNGGWSTEAKASTTGETAQATHVIVEANKTR